MEEVDLDILANALYDAKTEELCAKTRRLLIEIRIAEALPSVGVEGTVTRVAGDYKLKVKRSLLRSLDHEAYLAINVPPEQAFVTYKPTLDMKALRNADVGYAAACVTEKPSKISVTIERIDK